MIVINLGHPLPVGAEDAIASVCGELVDSVHVAALHIVDDVGLVEQVSAALDETGISVGQWQTEPLAVVLPGLSVAAAAVLAEIHGRSGHFPAVLRPVRCGPAGRFNKIEVIDLDSVRCTARSRRWDSREE